MIDGPWIHRDASVNGVRLHYVEAGEGPLVLLLHGFPEFWYAWRHQIPALAGAGYRVIAPDLRGYNLSEKPRGTAHYRLPTLVEDVVALIRHAGAERAVVAGHDWGGVIAWTLAHTRPEALEKLIVLNAAHPGALARELRDPRQVLRLWYAVFFQIPGLPEAAIRARGYRAIRGVLRRDPNRRDAYTREDVERYVEAISRPGALTAALNYYRANLRRGRRGTGVARRRIEAPTLLIWGEEDRAQRVSLTEGLERWVADLRVERLPGVSHWVMAEAPERVNALILDFLARV